MRILRFYEVKWTEFNATVESKPPKLNPCKNKSNKIGFDSQNNECI